jgi:urease accessory protein UreE
MGILTNLAQRERMLREMKRGTRPVLRVPPLQRPILSAILQQIGNQHTPIYMKNIQLTRRS